MFAVWWVSSVFYYLVSVVTIINTDIQPIIHKTEGKEKAKIACSCNFLPFFFVIS